MLSAAAAAALLTLTTRVNNSTCYTANVTSYTWCKGYESVGYSCVDDYCSSSTCLGDCLSCSQSYINSVIDTKDGRCCTSISSDGICIGPLSGDAPYNPPYGFPNHGPGGLIVEGPVYYNNGPKVWGPGSENETYAFTMLAQSGKTDEECPSPPLPSNNSWSPGANSRVISLRSHGEPISDCVIACNWTEVSESGIDPCNVGSIVSPVFASYSCYYGGPGWLKGKDLGVCGFNCSARHVVGGAFCTDADIKAGLCDVYCDPRDFP